MDPFDFDNSSSIVETILAGIQRPESAQLFTKKGITGDVFLNLHQEDLDAIGITDPDEQDKLLGVLKPFRAKYKEYYDPVPIRCTTILNHSVQQLNAISQQLIFTYKALKKSNPVNTLIDVNFSAAKALYEFSNIAIEQLDYISSDLNVDSQKQRKAQVKQRRLRRASFFLLGTSCILAFVIWYRR